MTKTFTQDDVVRYLYDDIPPADKKAFENALICDTRLLDLFRELKSVQESLNLVQRRPGNQVTKKILDYAKSCNLHSVKK